MATQAWLWQLRKAPRGSKYMQRATRDKVYTVHSKDNAPQITVEPGETFIVETEMCSGDWLKSADDVWAPGKGFGPNPAVCIAVAGAEPGDVLAVRIDDVRPGGLGYTGFAPGQNPFPDWIRRKEWGVVTRTVRIRDGYVEWGDRRIPIRPMIGTLGVAPAREVFTNAWPGRHGGNMDIPEVTTGATVYLPVQVEGALLHVGDMHAIQGDGEINCGGGIECRGEATLTVELVSGKPERMGWPRIANDTHLMTVGFARPAEDAFRLATEQLVYWLADAYGYNETEAFMLLGLVMEARVTQFVNPLYTYLAKVPRRWLPQPDAVKL